MKKLADSDAAIERRDGTSEKGDITQVRRDSD
jgi:hypothetical protein